MLFAFHRPRRVVRRALVTTYAGWQLLAVPALLAVSLPAASAQQSDRQAARARAVVERMATAHGGVQRWKTVSTLQYDNVFFNPASGGNPWWVTRETTQLDSMHAFHEWPLDGATLGANRHEVWTRNWRQANPPAFMSYFFFRFLSLPWLALDPSARLGLVGTASLPGRSGVFDTLRVTWDAAPLPGQTREDYFVLYVDQTSGLLQGYQYGIGYGAMLDLLGLPPERQVFGPVLRLHDAFIEVDGLVFPSRMRTGSLDGSRVAGHHTLFNYVINAPWDPDRICRPADAVVDSSSATRRR